MGDRGTKPSSSMTQQAEAGQIPLQVEQPSLVLGLQQFRFTPFSPARRPSAVTQPVYFSTMALLDRRACRIVAESGGPARASSFVSSAGCQHVVDGLRRLRRGRSGRNQGVAVGGLPAIQYVLHQGRVR